MRAFFRTHSISRGEYGNIWYIYNIHVVWFNSAISGTENQTEPIGFSN